MDDKFDKFYKSLLGVLIVLVVIYILTLVTSCSHNVLPKDGGTADDCDAACINMEELQCDGWEGSPGEDEVLGTEDDVSCVEVCVYLMNESSMDLYPICTANAETCEEVDGCFE